MLRRIFLALTLALLFGLGQQGAAMHAVTHLADAQEQQPDKQHNSSTCEQCVAYAKLTGAAPAAVFFLPAIPAHPVFAESPSVAANTLHRLAYTARAPPFLS